MVDGYSKQKYHQVCDHRALDALLHIWVPKATPIGGLKVAAISWFAARPSGTESIYKIYVESFKDREHLNAIVSEAQAIVKHTL